MAERQEQDRLRVRKGIATIGVATWLSCIALVGGPVRWELQYAWGHWIGATRPDLPQLTVLVALPILGIESSTATAVAVGVGFWTLAIALPLLALVRIWRATSREELVEFLVLAGLPYFAILALGGMLTVLGLLLPWAPV